MNYGLKIKLSRIEKGYTQKQLGELIGVKSVTIRSYENGTREPKIKTMKKLSEILEKSVQELFFD